MSLLSKLLVILYIITMNSFADEFPLRAKYADLKFISTKGLKKIIDKVNIVDARSTSEYKVIHMNKAVNIVAGKQSFISILKQKYPDKNTKIVFYCNGHTCSKSYKAGRKAKNAGYINTLVYDSGIFEWAKAYPQTVTLLNETPLDTSKLISKEDFKKHLISYDEFKKKAIPYKSTIIDIREPYQKYDSKSLRQYYFPKIKNVKMISVVQDKLVKNILSKGYEKDRVLLIADNVGKEVKWLQYYLEKYGYKNYYFLAKGVRGLY